MVFMLDDGWQGVFQVLLVQVARHMPRVLNVNVPVQETFGGVCTVRWSNLPFPG